MAYGDYYSNPEDSFFGQESNFMNPGQDPFGMSQGYGDLFDQLTPNYQSAYEANLDAGMDVKTAAEPGNLPNLTQQMFGAAFGDLGRTVDLENLRQQSYQQGINTAGSAIDDFSKFTEMLGAGLSESTLQMYEDQLRAGEEGKQAKLERLEDYRSTLEDQFASNELGSERMFEMMAAHQAKGAARTAKMEDSIGKWMEDSSKWRKDAKKDFNRYAKKVTERDEKMVEAQQKARDDFELNLIATAQAKISGMQESYESTNDLVALDPNMSDDQKAALKAQNKSRYSAQLQGVGSNIVNEQNQMMFQADQSVAAALQTSAGNYQQLAQLSNQNAGIIASNVQGTMNTAASLMSQAQQIGSSYDTAAMGLGVKAIEMRERNEAMLSKGYAQVAALEGQLQDSYIANISNAAQMFSTNIFRTAQTMVQGKQIELDGNRDLAALYTNRSFNYPVAMDAISSVMSHAMALMSAGINPDASGAFGLGAAWQGSPFNMVQRFQLPDDYLGGGAAPHNTIAMTPPQGGKTPESGGQGQGQGSTA